MAAVPVSKPVTSGIVTRKAAIDPSSASHFTALALRPPIASSTAPTAIGSQMAILSKPISCVLRASRSSASGPGAQVRPELPGHEAEHAQDHEERVPVEVTGLDAAQHAGEGAHGARGPVDEHAV